jgi:hypothetical protein
MQFLTRHSGRICICPPSHEIRNTGPQVHAKRVRRDRRGHARGLFQSICRVHFVLPSMSEQVAVQKKISRSTTTIHSTNVSIDSKVLVGRCGQERASLSPNGTLRGSSLSCQSHPVGEAWQNYFPLADNSPTNCQNKLRSGTASRCSR